MESCSVGVLTKYHKSKYGCYEELINHFANNQTLPQNNIDEIFWDEVYFALVGKFESYLNIETKFI